MIENLFWKKKEENSLIIYTVWYLQNFSINQILREIKNGESKVSNPAILANSEALNFEFHDILQFLKNNIYQMNRIQSPLNELLHSPTRNSLQCNFFIKSIYRKAACWRRSQCGKMKNLLSLKQKSSNQLFSNFFT